MKINHGLKFHRLSAFTLLLMLSGCTEKSQPIEKEPNTIFITTDDHTTQALSACDKRHIETPNLDMNERCAI